jgi:integrase
MVLYEIARRGAKDVRQVGQVWRESHYPREESSSQAKRQVGRAPEKEGQMSQQGTIRNQSGFWVFRYRTTRPEVHCRICGRLQNRHAHKSHAFDGETRIVRVQLAKNLGQVRAEDKRLRKEVPKYIRDEAEKILGPINNSTLAPEKNIFLADFVENVYFPFIVSEGMKPSTIAGYRGRWNSQLKLRLAGTRLREFRAKEADELFREIAKLNPTMTRSTLHHFKSLLSAIYRVAIIKEYVDGFREANGKIHGNPIREASVPRSAPDGEDTFAYSADEVASMLGLLPEPAKTAAAVAGCTGLRACEVFALRWEDWKGDYLQVERAVWNGQVGRVKTRASRAPVEVIESLRKQLTEWRWRNNDAQSGFMFATGNGTPLDQTNVVDRQIIPALNVCARCKKSEDEHGKDKHKYERDPSRPQWRGWHAFRRGLATTLHALGENDQTIQNILRHANVKTTQQCYIKSVPANSKSAMRRFGQMFESKALNA